MPRAKQLVISNFQNGMGESEFTGLGFVKNIDTDVKPGAALAALLPEEEADGTLGETTLFKWIVQDPDTGNHYALRDDGKVFKRTWSSGAWSDVSHATSTTNASGNGMVIWKGYLLTFRDQLINVLKLSDDSWTNTSWQPDSITITDDAWHPAVVGQDDAVYFGHGRYIGKLAETAGQDFAASDATTTATQEALDLPEGYRVRCLAELGKNLMIGTWYKNSTNPDAEKGDIFPWDRLSQSFNLPIQTKELGIRSMLAHNGILYFVAGLQGQLYATDGSRIVKLRRLPRHIFGLSGGKWVDVYPDAMAWHKNKLLIGTTVNNTTADDGYGIWSYDNGKIQFEYETSEGLSGSKAVYIGSIHASSEDELIFSWENTTDSSAGVDYVSASKRYGSYKSYIETKFYDVAFKHEKRTFRSLEIRLGKDLKTSEGVRVKYRTDIDDSWTTLATFTDADNTHRSDIFLEVETLQLRIELTTDGAGLNSNSSPELLAVILH